MAEETMKAVVLPQKGEPNMAVGTYPKPGVEKGMVRIRTKATAINPVDWKMAKYHFLIKEYPIVLGCDGAGVVDTVGEGVTKVEVGDEVASFPGLGAPGRGTFAEYFVTEEANVLKRPKDVSFEEMTTYPVGTLTACLGLYEQLKLPLPSEAQPKDEYFLVWGGSSGVGSMVVQLAALSGYKVIATASKRNFDLVRSLGATEVVDYTSDNAVEQIVKIADGKLSRGYDTIGNDTAALVAKVLKESGGGAFAACAGGLKDPVEGVTCHDIMLGTLPDQPGGWTTLAKYYAELQPLIDGRKIKPFAVKKYEGWEGVLQALKDSEEGKVSGEKLVVSV